MKLNPEAAMQCKILYQNKVLDIDSCDWEMCGGEITMVYCKVSPSFYCADTGHAAMFTPLNFAFSKIKPISDIALRGYNPITPYLIEPEKEGDWAAHDKTESVRYVCDEEELDDKDGADDYADDLYDLLYNRGKTVKQIVSDAKNKLPDDEDELDEVYYKLRDMVECIEENSKATSSFYTNARCSVRIKLPNIGTMEAPLAKFLAAWGCDSGMKVEFTFVED